MPLDIKLTRRELLSAGATAAVIPALGPLQVSPTSASSHGYTRVLGWGKTSDNLGWGVGIACDSQDRVYVHSRTEKAVIVFDRHGRRLRDFGSEFAATGHGLTWHRQGREEFLFFCDHGRNLVVKTDLFGKPLHRIGEVGKQSSDCVHFPFNQPTDLAAAPDGRLFVAEGYGGNRVQVFSSTGRHLYTIGGPGTAPGRFSCPHGIWVDTRRREPELYVADRSNQRIQALSLEGKFLRSIEGTVRLPNGFCAHVGKLLVPDLDGFVSILDQGDKLLARLGQASEGRPKDPFAFSAPHAACVDSHGDLYVIEWTERAAVHKFRSA